MTIGVRKVHKLTVLFLRVKWMKNKFLGKSWNFLSSIPFFDERKSDLSCSWSSTLNGHEPVNHQRRRDLKLKTPIVHTFMRTTRTANQAKCFALELQTSINIRKFTLRKKTWLEIQGHNKMPSSYRISFAPFTFVGLSEFSFISISRRKEATMILNLLLQNTPPTLAAKLPLNGAIFSPLDSLEKESNISNVLSELSVFQWTWEKLRFKEIELRNTIPNWFYLGAFLSSMPFLSSQPS